jgi:hypothetical protein
MPTLDVFRADAFSLTSLTEAFIKADYQPGRLGALGLFRERGITTTSVMVEEKEGQLSLISTSPRGGVPSTIGKAKRTARSFLVPHLERIGHINADEVQNIRAFGSETETEAVMTRVNGILAELRPMHEVTLEYHRMGALQGVILDADASTTIYNLFTEFDVQQQTGAIAFATSTTDIRNAIVAILRLIEAEMGGTVATGYRGFCGATFFDALIGHATVKEAFKYQQGQQLGADLRTTGFNYGGVIWEEYRGSVAKPDGSGNASFINASQAFIAPICNPSIFVTSWSPADFMETVNTTGLPGYAKIAIDPLYQKWAEVLTQSNPLCLNLRPRAVYKATMS